LPDGAGPFPAVVLVHGSGPHDRDETIGPNRPFLDIARGLAAQGIAVLRYEKRTKARPQDFVNGDFTMDDETTDDAVNAIAALSGDSRIDHGHIFVLGHSQGAMLAPRIAEKSGLLAGVIMLAAPARSLLDILPEQNHYLLNLDGNISAEEQVFLDDLQHKIDVIRGAGEVATTDSPLGVPAHYWREAEKIHPLADAKSLTVPMLLLQGGRDYQVTDSDWQLWEKAFPDDSRVTMKYYPLLNHLGIAGEGTPRPEEYNTPGHVDAQLIGDVAAWIKAL
jgi:dienelactone hydrolase